MDGCFDKGSYRGKHGVVTGREGQWGKVSKMKMEGEMRDGEMDCRNVRLHTLFVSGFIPDILNLGGGEGGGCVGSSFIEGFTRIKAIRYCGSVQRGKEWGWVGYSIRMADNVAY
ncbi:Uncharacterized protein APZ42_008267 [Daphnia magna]|uniref:Uncharacterized protein n=1 Tax=Daphnia magna TaxID=35525 RepID=A0A164ERW5_9CRUS|nr:Uncharacterized protein APZ42_008267 [Daphnia magna]